MEALVNEIETLFAPFRGNPDLHKMYINEPYFVHIMENLVRKMTTKLHDAGRVKDNAVASGDKEVIMAPMHTPGDQQLTALMASDNVQYLKADMSNHALEQSIDMNYDGLVEAVITRLKSNIRALVEEQHDVAYMHKLVDYIKHLLDKISVLIVLRFKNTGGIHFPSPDELGPELYKAYQKEVKHKKMDLEERIKATEEELRLLHRAESMGWNHTDKESYKDKEKTLLMMQRFAKDAYTPGSRSANAHFYKYLHDKK